MPTLQELSAQQTQRHARLMALTQIMEGANGRSLTDAEENEITEIRNGADALENKIKNARFLADQKADDAARQFERMGGASTGDSEDADKKKVAARYSIVRAAQYAAGKTTASDAALEKEMHEEATKEAREANLPVTGKGVLMPSFIQQRATAATAADAGNLIATNQMATIEGYKPVLYVEQLGATMHSGLTGINNIPIADFEALAAFIGEGNAFPAVTSNIRRPSATAKGLMGKLTNSWFLKAQAGPESDRVLTQSLDRAINNALNTNVVNRANANSSHGILGAADIIDVSGANGSAFSRDLLITMINSAAKNNAGGDRAGWLLSPTVRETAQKEKTDAGSGIFVWDANSPNQLLGYNAAVTTLMPVNLTKGSGTNLKGATFGYWDNLHMFNWAVKELIVDPASDDTGVVIKQLEFWDWVFANPKAFAKAYFT